VEQAVLMEFDRLNLRGGVLAAMETGYQRNKIQQESMQYEVAKHEGSLPIVGVNFAESIVTKSTAQKNKVIRSSTEEKLNQIQRLKQFKHKYRRQSALALDKLKQVAITEDNIFAELMNTVQVCTLGQITHALFEVGGKYRRNM
jgi:methylmalonyl-CoA mutase